MALLQRRRHQLALEKLVPHTMHNLNPSTATTSQAPKRKQSCLSTASMNCHQTRRDSPAHTPQTTRDSHADHLPALIQPSSFRNVSSCNRCRLRKTRCDQRLPRCQPCEKAGTRCVGYDAISKREIPRSHVYFLETRVNYLMKVLVQNGISFKPVSDLDEEVLPAVDGLESTSEKHGIATPETHPDICVKDTGEGQFSGLLSAKEGKRDIPTKESVLHTVTGGESGCTLRESISSLHAETSEMDSPILPDREVAERLVNCYFEYASPQMPVLLRNEFKDLFDRIYSGEDRTARRLSFLYIVFAIGAGIIFDDRCPPTNINSSASRSIKRRRVSSSQCQPKDYHSCAIRCLELSLNSGDRFGRLEELQAVILLAHFALLQPAAPGPARLTEVAVRTAVNLGCYHEDEIDAGPGDSLDQRSDEIEARQDRLRDLRRRLWWSAYSLDRLVAPYIGRPFSISDQVITTEFPSIFGTDITRAEPYSRNITHHYFKLRLLQSEIHEVLQCQRSQQRRSSNKSNTFANVSSFLVNFDSFTSWRKDMNRRLDEWKNSIPDQKTGICFPVVLLELDYWQAINLLYRQSINVPVELDELTPANGPARYSTEESGPQNSVYLKVAEASGKVLQLYRVMHHVRLVNYTYLATHSIFLAGSSFLFTIWHSPLIRSQLTLNEIDYTLLAGTTILADMGDRYPHAAACRDALERMGATTVQMCLSTPEFSSRVDKSCAPLSRNENSANCVSRVTDSLSGQCMGIERGSMKRKSTSEYPQFDMNLEGLLNGLDSDPKPPREPLQEHLSLSRRQRCTLSEQKPQFQGPQCPDHESLESPGQQQLHPACPQSMSPISVPGSWNDQSSGSEIQPAISLDLFEFGFAGSDGLPFIGDGNFGQSPKSDSSFAEGLGNLGFSIAVDSQPDFDKGSGYDCLDTFLAS